MLLKPLSERRFATCVAGLALLGHVAVAFTHGGPVAVPDVSAYLAFSQWLYGGIIPDETVFNPGYGLLLGAFGWLSGEQLHTAALIVNGLLVAVVVLVTARLTHILGGSQGTVKLVTLIAAIHPSLSASSRIAWPETLLTLLITAATLTVVRQRWAHLGWIVGLGIIIHPRVLVVVCAAAVVAALGGSFRKFAIGVGPALGLTAVALQVTSSWPSERVAAARYLNEDPGPLATALGQWLAVSAGTAGMASIAIMVGISRLKDRREVGAETFLALSALGMLLLGGWVLAGSGRVDTLMYGRYMGPWMIPLAVVAIVFVSKSQFTTPIAIGAIVPTVVATLFAASQLSSVDQPPRRIMTLTMSFLWEALGDSWRPVIFLAGAIAIVGVLSVKPVPFLPAVAILLMSLTSTFLNHRHLAEVGRIADGQVTITDHVPDELECLSHDASVKSYSLWLYRLALPELEHQRVRVTSNEQLCSPYVVAGDHELDRCSNARLLANEPRAKWGLWYLSLGQCD